MIPAPGPMDFPAGTLRKMVGTWKQEYDDRARRSVPAGHHSPAQAHTALQHQLEILPPISNSDYIVFHILILQDYANSFSTMSNLQIIRNNYFSPLMKIFD